jgi:hypothetical protein
MPRRNTLFRSSTTMALPCNASGKKDNDLSFRSRRLECPQPVARVRERFIWCKCFVFFCSHSPLSSGCTWPAVVCCCETFSLSISSVQSATRMYGKFGMSPSLPHAVTFTRDRSVRGCTYRIRRGDRTLCYLLE